jgi:hypothetical protein
VGTWLFGGEKNFERLVTFPMGILIVQPDVFLDPVEGVFTPEILNLFCGAASSVKMLFTVCVCQRTNQDSTDMARIFFS